MSVQKYGNLTVEKTFKYKDLLNSTLIFLLVVISALGFNSVLVF